MYQHFNDEFTDIGGSYVVDTETGKRMRDPNAPQPHGTPPAIATDESPTSTDQTEA